MPKFAICDSKLPCIRVLVLFLAWFVVVGTLLLLALAAGAEYDRENERLRVRLSTRQSTDARQELVSRTFWGVVPDLRFLAEQNELEALLAEDSQRNRDSLCHEFAHFIQEKGTYCQVRYLDEDGMEVCRVDLRGGKAVIVPPAELQNKRQTPYFRDAIGLAEGQIFVSMLDLNVEHGEVEVPYNPVIRFCKPIRDAAGKQRGMVVINQMAGLLLAQVRRVNSPISADTYLLNAQGYYLLGPSPEKEWGFMFPERRHCRFQGDYPEAWEEISTQDSGQFIRHGCLFTFARIHPLPEGTVSSGAYRLDESSETSQPLASDQYCLIVLSVLPEAEMLAQASWLALNVRSVATALLAILGLVSFAVARGTVRKQVAQETIARMATFDALTGLPNRNLFMDRIEQSRERALRYKQPFALLFLDLNGFKAINDTLGHAMGDELLRQVAKRLRHSLRASDTLARVGGDEFVVIAEQTRSREDAEVVARKLLAALEPPFTLGSAARLIGASIGIALHDPVGRPSADMLIRMADEAMYDAKATRENTFRHYTLREQALEERDKRLRSD